MQVGQLFENKISYGDEYGERVSDKNKYHGTQATMWRTNPERIYGQSTCIKG